MEVREGPGWRLVVDSDRHPFCVLIGGGEAAAGAWAAELTQAEALALRRGMNTLQERFNAEWLFRNPLRIQGPVVNSAGQTIVSFAGTNIDEAYGRTLPLRLDSDGDCWPDAWDAAPFQPGIKDGVVN